MRNFKISFLKGGNEETVAMIKREGNKAFSYTVDMSSRYDSLDSIIEQHSVYSSRDAIYDNAKKTESNVGHISILVNNGKLRFKFQQTRKN